MGTFPNTDNFHSRYRLHFLRQFRMSPQFQLFEQSCSSSASEDSFHASDNNFASSSMSSTEVMDPSAASILHQITTVIGKSASTAVSLSFFLLLAYHRNALLLTLFLGSILNSILGKILKKILNHERPAELQSNANVKLKPSDGGMPSSHAMSLGFIGTVILVGVISPENRWVIGSMMAIYSAIALRYRVRDHLHTLDQVGVGLVLGVGNALAWLKFGMGIIDARGNDDVGPIFGWVQQNWVSAETGLFPYEALAIPVLVGVLVVGSFERRIGQWIKNKRKVQ